MEKDILKDLFNQKRYNEVIDLIKSLYCDLYEEMLKYKNYEADYSSMDYTAKTALVRENYPQFLDNFIFLQSIASDPNNTYLDYINVLLSTYMFFKKEYKNTLNNTEYNNDEAIEFIDNDE